MIKEILLNLMSHIIDQETNPYYYAFRYNLKDYFVYLGHETDHNKGGYNLFCYTDFQLIEPIQLITDFWVNNNDVELTGKKQIQMSDIDQLKETSFSQALGQYLKLVKIENIGAVEKYAPVGMAELFLNLTQISSRFFISKEGLSIFTYDKTIGDNKGKIPQGLIAFNPYNFKYIGYPLVRIDRKNREYAMQKNKNEELFSEDIHLMFSPYTLLSVYNNGRSYFKDNFLILADGRKMSYIDHQKTFIHLRPSLQELYHFLLFVQTHYSNNAFPSPLNGFKITINENNTVFVDMYVENYAKEYNTYIAQMNTYNQKLRGDESNEIKTVFNLKLLKKKTIFHTSDTSQTNYQVDFVQYSFPLMASNCFTFIEFVIFEKNKNLKNMTTIYYQHHFPSKEEIEREKEAMQDWDDDLNEQIAKIVETQTYPMLEDEWDYTGVDEMVEEQLKRQEQREQEEQEEQKEQEETEKPKFQVD